MSSSAAARWSNVYFVFRIEFNCFCQLGYSSIEVLVLSPIKALVIVVLGTHFTGNGADDRKVENEGNSAPQKKSSLNLHNTSRHPAHRIPLPPLLNSIFSHLLILHHVHQNPLQVIVERTAGGFEGGCGHEFISRREKRNSCLWWINPSIHLWQQ